MATKLLSLLASTLALTGLFASSAQAFTFTTNYTSSLTGSNQSKGNIFLNSVKIDSTGKTVSNFALVNQVNILQNDVWTGGDTGAASADNGDLANNVKQEHLPVGNSPDAVKALGNLNLNNIIDGEDKGSYKMNLFFNKAVDKLFFWERNANSYPIIQAIDATGNVLGKEVILGKGLFGWKDAGFSLDTTEITDVQKVGSIGISLTDLFGSGTNVKSIAGIQVTAMNSSDFKSNGPDFKVVGASVPEPTTVLGLGLVGGALVMSRRKKA